MTESSPRPPSQIPDFPDPERAEVLLRLGHEISEMSAHLDAGTYQLLQLIGRFDQQGGWHGTGILSCAHWLNWQCGIESRRRPRTSTRGPALPGLPGISAAFREGRVSYSKVRAMTRVATASQ